ncbi:MULTISPECIES: PP2C family protein-serine/threonine phosphatase [Streptomyces]|uniref:PP2C family protein-serine/threonine phosphatase n=1 Tax=Streptomyces TaxID=1883 RepID=UPI0022597A31|nr:MULTISPECIES: PP2C family protein-serine/threonine phosphatase [Streptomyces]MCX4806952.1 serine/threonine-protein phosphatase [Streptomyces sp. NBC_01214]MCX5274904.1 serine/threonine-protein phosphatase [Streptomyces virginiae]WSQ03691.1 serine/threonine-protein phosphatase [Streptomyces sp. NBC_01232]WSR20379.1 serine/threonine-protein phosphatase [Streptomyces sp. NBC_01207]
MALVAAADVTAGPGVGLLPLVSLGPAFAGLAGSWRRTATIGAAAMALCCALGLYDGLFPNRRGYTALVAVAGVTVAGVAAAVVRTRQERELASVRTIAEAAQRVLLRPVPRSAGHLRAAVSYTSAVAEARIGGDLYEVVPVPGGVRVIIGDVQGKGLEAVETAATVLGAFREAAHDEPRLSGVGARVERAVQRSLEGEGDGEKFVTALLAEITEGGDVAFLNYGHAPAMLVRPGSPAAFPEPPQHAPPLGLIWTASDSPEPYSVGFGPGDQLLLYTDGVSEARNSLGAFYPLGEQSGLLSDPDPQRALDALREDVVAYVGGPLHDDAAMLLLRCRQEDGEPPRHASASQDPVRAPSPGTSTVRLPEQRRPSDEGDDQGR